MKKKVCFRCRRKIEERDNYYSFTEFDNKKILHTDYAHKKCWEEFIKQVGNVEESMGIIHGLKNKLTEIGFLPKEEIVIRWIKKEQ